MAEDAKATPAVLGEVEVVTAPTEGTHGGRHMTSTMGTQAEVDSALRYSAQTEGTSSPDTAPTTPVAAPVPDAAPVTPEVVAPDKKVEDPRSVQGRIDRYAKQAHEADRRAVLAEQRTADLELQIATQQLPAAPMAPAVEPIPAEFQTTEELGDYIARTVKSGVETGLAERDTKTRETQAEVAATQVSRTWEAQLTSAAAAHEDWSAVFTQAGTTESGTDAVLEVAKTFANGAQVLYDLAKSPQALTHMGQMTQRDRERAFAVASDRVQRAAEAGQADPVITTPSFNPAPAVPSVPAALTPMVPVTPSAPSATPPVLNEQSTRGDYKAWKVANGIKF